MAQSNRQPITGGQNVTGSRARASSVTGRVVNRSAASGRSVSQPERAAAARARVSADKKRGAVTASWIVKLAREAD